MKNVRENLMKTVLVIMVAMMALNARSYKAYAEEETVPQQAEQEVLDLTEESEEIVETVELNEEETVIIEEKTEEVNEEIVEEETKELSEEVNNETEEITEIVNEEMVEELNEEVEEANEEVAEETKEVSWESYTLYNYISLDEGKTYISLNTQENGIRTQKSAEQFHKDNGNKRYDLSSGEYEIAGYDLSSLVITTAGYSFVEQSVAREGQPYFIARLDRVEAVAAARFRPSDCVEGIESFASLGTSSITFHRNWYLTLVTPMTSNRLLTGVRLGDGKNGNGDGKYYGLSYTENFQAVDSRLIPFGTKLRADQYSIEDYDFTGLTLQYKGETYAYRPNGPVAGDGEGFHYYTVSFMKVDKLNKSTYGGGYLAENWPAWPLINSTSGSDGYPYQAGYYHRDYQATLMVGDAPAIIEEKEEEPVIEETVKEETVAEKIREEETVIEETIKEETTVEDTAEEAVKEETVQNIAEEETVVENTVKEDTKAAETVKEEAVKETVKEETKATVTVKEETVNEATVETSSEEAVQNTATNETAESITVDNGTEDNTPVQEVSANTEIPGVLDIRDEIVPLAAAVEASVEENGNWALANLVLALISVLGMILTMNREAVAKFLGIVPAALAVLSFLLTEDTGNTMVLIDSYTLMMAVFPLASLLIAWITRDRKEENSVSAPVASPVN